MIKRFARGQRGVTTVEFAFIALALFGFVCGVIELALIMFAQSSLENAARVASRYGITGQTGSSGTREDAILAEARSQFPPILDPAKLQMKMLVYKDFSSIGKPEPFTDTPPPSPKNNGKYDLGESFTDVNGNGKWDSDQGVASGGGTRAIVLYNLIYPWDPQFGLTRLFHLTPVTLSSRIVVKNEP